MSSPLVIDLDALPDEIEIEPQHPPPSSSSKTTSKALTSKNLSTSLVTPHDDISDPTPDVHALFSLYNERHFDGMLTNVYVEFSTRMTLCAGTCTYKGPIGGCRIALSEPLLKLRPASDLRSTLLHEMIHAYLFGKGISRDGPDGHGPLFMQIAQRINQIEAPHILITPYHTFNDEVEHYRTHHWQCQQCKMIIKRAMNRKPGPYDLFWEKHIRSCGGAFTKIKEPPPSLSKKEKRKKVVAVGTNNNQKRKDKRKGKESDETFINNESTNSQFQNDNNVVETFRIDEMIAASSRLKKKRKTTNSQRDNDVKENPNPNPNPSQSRSSTQPFTEVACPVCNKRVSQLHLNQHLDECLAKDFADDVVEVPVTQQPTTPCNNNTVNANDNSKDDEIIIPATPTPPSSPKHPSANDDIIPSSPNIPSPPSSPEIVAVPATTTTKKRHVSSSPRRSFFSNEPLNKPSNPYTNAHVLINNNNVKEEEEEEETETILMNLAQNPYIVSTEKINKVCNSIFPEQQQQQQQQQHNQKSPAFRDLLRPIMSQPTPIDLITTAERHMRTAKIPNTEEPFTFSEFSHRLGTRSSVGGGRNEKPDIESTFKLITEQGKELPDGKGLEISKGVLIDLLNGNNSKQQGIVNNNGGRDGHGRCPICDKSVLQKDLQVHINTCLDDADIRNGFFTQDDDENMNNDGGGGGGGETKDITETETKGCPICDKMVLKIEFEKHVSSCMAQAGLHDAF